MMYRLLSLSGPMDYWREAEWDKLGEQARFSLDQAQREAAYKRMQEIMDVYYPWLPVIVPIESHGVASYVNWRSNPNQTMELRKDVFSFNRVAPGEGRYAAISRSSALARGDRPLGDRDDRLHRHAPLGRSRAADAAADAPTSEMNRVRAELGLDQPIPIQYAVFIGNARGDLGRSIHMRQPAIDIAIERLPATIELALVAFLLAVVVALPAGLISAAKRDSIWDNIAMFFALIGQSAPTFYIGIMLILVMGLQLGWFPVSARPGKLAEPGDWGTMPGHVFPVTLGAFAMAIIARLTRSAVLEVMRQDYIRTARAKGLNDIAVLVRHNLKNAAIPIVTIMGLQFGTLLGGAVVTETVFAWPGIGLLAIKSIGSRDYPIVQSAVLLVAMAFVFVNFLVDLAYGWLDPRIRYA